MPIDTTKILPPVDCSPFSWNEKDPPARKMPTVDLQVEQPREHQLRFFSHDISVFAVDILRSRSHCPHQRRDCQKSPREGNGAFCQKGLQWSILNEAESQAMQCPNIRCYLILNVHSMIRCIDNELESISGSNTMKYHALTVYTTIRLNRIHHYVHTVWQQPKYHLLSHVCFYHF